MSYRLAQLNPDQFPYLHDAVANLKYRIYLLDKYKPARAPGEQTWIDNLLNGYAEWRALSVKAQTAYCEKLRREYRAARNWQHLPEGDEVYSKDYGLALQDATFGDIGGAGIRESISIGQSIVETEIAAALLRTGSVVIAEFRAVSTRLDKASERLVMDYLEGLGYTDVIQIQNASNHGIDVVARNKRGQWLFFEVKATTGRRIPRLSLAQRNPDAFILDRLQLAADREVGAWKSLDQQTADTAKRILRDLENDRIRSYRVKVRYPKAGSEGPPTLRVLPWVRK